MYDPWRRFKSQPWQPLLQVAVITTLLIVLLEGLLIVGFTQLEFFQRSLRVLFAPPLGLIVSIAAAVGVGVLGVTVCERWRSPIILNVASLWALILCLIGGVLLKSLLPIPSLLVGLSYPTVVGVIIGVFWKGRPYWH